MVPTPIDQRNARSRHASITSRDLHASTTGTATLWRIIKASWCVAFAMEPGASADKLFNRTDVFKRHLIAG